MARTVRDARLETRAARDRLVPRPSPYWRTLTPGAVHLGYRRRRKGVPGVWLIRRYQGLGRYREETLPGFADDYQDADGAAVLSFAQAQERALRQVGVAGPLTVAEAIADYLSYLELERRTAVDARFRANAHILPQLGDLKIEELTTAQLRRWRDHLASTPKRVRSKRAAPQKHKVTDPRARQASANRVLTTLKAALNRAFRDGLVADDKAWRALEPFEAVGAARPGYLTLVEARQLIDAADSGFRELVHGALITGCRYGELCAMRVRDFHRGKIAIRQSKSGKPRDVVLADDGVLFFEQLTAGRHGGDFMFVRADGSPWLASQQARPMLEACRRAKIEPPVGIHQLRHTWASHAVMNGMPLMVVARNLGHANTQMVEKHYGHLSQTFVDDAIRASAPRFGAA